MNAMNSEETIPPRSTTAQASSSCGRSTLTRRTPFPASSSSAAFTVSATPGSQSSQNTWSQIPIVASVGSRVGVRQAASGSATWGSMA